jgi:hypothetical protein
MVAVRRRGNDAVSVAGDRRRLPRDNGSSISGGRGARRQRATTVTRASSRGRNKYRRGGARRRPTAARSGDSGSENSRGGRDVGGDDNRRNGRDVRGLGIA